MFKYFNNKKGSAVVLLLLFVIIVLSIIIYFGYYWYQEKYYINLYDNTTIDRTIEIPPYVERLTEANKELIGECDLRVIASLQQVIEFYRSYSHKCGFEFEATSNSFKMTIRKGYVIEGNQKGTNLEMRWIPDLDGKQITKAKKLFGKIKIATKKEDDI